MAKGRPGKGLLAQLVISTKSLAPLIEGLLRLLDESLPEAVRQDEVVAPVLSCMQESVERFKCTIGHLTAQQQTRLFQLFQRLHTHVEGTGVGLYAVKKKCGRHHHG